MLYFQNYIIHPNNYQVNSGEEKKQYFVSIHIVIVTLN